MMVRKRNRKTATSALLEMMKDMHATGHLQNFKTIVNPQDEVKMSEMVTALIKPYRDDLPKTLKAYEGMIGIACIAWNTSLMPKDKQAQTISAAVTRLTTPTELDMRTDMAKLIMELIKRKELLFPDIHRRIVSFKVTETKDQYHVAIASTLQTDKD